MRDVFAANDDLVFVQLSDSRKWNANKVGRRLEVGIVATSVGRPLSTRKHWKQSLTTAACVLFMCLFHVLFERNSSFEPLH